MSAEIIDVKAKRNPGNGAREALIEILSYMTIVDQRDAAAHAEQVLMELWVRGFKIVPTISPEKPARAPSEKPVITDLVALEPHPYQPEPKEPFFCDDSDFSHVERGDQ
jgi:hypothetical protein